MRFSEVKGVKRVLLSLPIFLKNGQKKAPPVENPCRKIWIGKRAVLPENLLFSPLSWREAECRGEGEEPVRPLRTNHDGLVSGSEPPIRFEGRTSRRVGRRLAIGDDRQRPASVEESGIAKGEQLR